MMSALLTTMKPLRASKRIRKISGLIVLRLKAKIDTAAAKAMMTAKNAISFLKT
jgi:hypothetical protein